MGKISILIVDDHMLIRETWAAILNNDTRFKVVELCGNADEATRHVLSLNPDIVMMDVNLPGLNGIEATEMILKLSSHTKILGVSLYNQASYARRMMQSGARGYITKNASREEMLRAIMEVYHGRKFIGEEIKQVLSDELITGKENKLHLLSPRERQIIALVKIGASSREIASLMTISIKTVEVHRYNILKKLGLKNAAALVNFINQHEIG